MGLRHLVRAARRRVHGLSARTRREAVAEIAEEASTRNILVVTHATPVKSAVVRLLGGGAEMIMRLRVSLASVTAFGPVSQGLVLTEFNWCPARQIG